jgi:hypothetical protein
MNEKPAGELGPEEFREWLLSRAKKPPQFRGIETEWGTLEIPCDLQGRPLWQPGENGKCDESQE